MISDNDCYCRECRQSSDTTLIFDNDFCLKFAIVILSYLFLWYLNLLPHFCIFLIIVNFIATILKIIMLLFRIKEKRNNLIKYYLTATIIVFIVFLILLIKY